MVSGIVICVLLVLFLRPSNPVLIRTLLVASGATVANALIAVFAAKRGLWTVRGAWPVAGYPLSMMIAWFFLVAGFCLALDRLSFGWSQAAFVALAGFGGATWDLRVHRFAGILVLDRARSWQVVLYWISMAFAAAVVFLL